MYWKFQFGTRNLGYETESKPNQYHPHCGPHHKCPHHHCGIHHQNDHLSSPPLQNQHKSPKSSMSPANISYKTLKLKVLETPFYQTPRFFLVQNKGSSEISRHELRFFQIRVSCLNFLLKGLGLTSFKGCSFEFWSWWIELSRLSHLLCNLHMINWFCEVMLVFCKLYLHVIVLCICCPFCLCCSVPGLASLKRLTELIQIAKTETQSIRLVDVDQSQLLFGKISNQKFQFSL